MLKNFVLGMVILFVSVVTVNAEDVSQELSNSLQNVSVVVKSNRGSGSGTIITRKHASGDTVSFVWTAGHVVESLKKTRSVVDPSTGTQRTITEFDDVDIVQELNQDGRRVGETKMIAKVIKYSNADNGHDLALLQVRKRNFVPETVSAKFYAEGNRIVPIGTELIHIGSLLGQAGANSLTTGNISQVGRIYPELGSEMPFDQTTVTAFPGSSGGGVFLKNGKNAGLYVGMLVRGAGETFNFIVPVRRMNEWVKHVKLDWAMDPSLPLPTDEELNKILVEDIGTTFKSNGAADAKKPTGMQFLFKYNEKSLTPFEMED